MTGGDPAVLQELGVILGGAVGPQTVLPDPPSAADPVDPAYARLKTALEEAPIPWVAAALKLQPAGLRDAYLEGSDEETRHTLQGAIDALPAELPPKLARAIDAYVGKAGEAGRGVDTPPRFADLLKGGSDDAGICG